MIQSHSTLAAQVCLQVRHQKSGGNSFAGDIADHEAKPLLAEIEEVEVVPSDLPGLNAHACIFQSLRLRMDLRKEPGLHLLCYFQFLGGAAFGFYLLGERAALRFNSTCQFIEAGEPEGVSIHNFKSCEDSAPCWNLRRRVKANATLAPFVVFGVDIFGDEVELAIATDEFVCLGIRWRQGQGDACAAVRRRNLDPSAARLEDFIHHQPETKLVNVETQASLLIANENHSEVQAKIEILPVQA
jgi:hypothetical protein